MKTRERHVCLGCGCDTAAKSQICNRCRRPYPEEHDESWLPEDRDRDDVVRRDVRMVLRDCIE